VMTEISCSSCTYANKDTATKCELCSAPINRPPSKVPTREWACIKCTYINVPLDAKCNICDAPRPKVTVEDILDSKKEEKEQIKKEEKKRKR